MEAAAIDRISAINDKLAELINTETVGHALYIPPGATLQHAEQFASAPRFQRHLYKTERIGDFIAYAKQTASDLGEDFAPTAYVLPDGSAAMAVFDHGHDESPQWGHHRAVLNLRAAPAWAAADVMTKNLRTQLQVIDWLEDWPEHITAHAQDGAGIEQRKAITALRRVKIEAKASVVNEEGDLARNRTALESIEARGDTETLPAYFILHSPLYVGTNLLEIVIRLGVRENDGKPGIALRIVGRERLQEDTSAWVEQTLRDQLGTALAGVYVGELSVGKP